MILLIPVGTAEAERIKAAEEAPTPAAALDVAPITPAEPDAADEHAPARGARMVRNLVAMMSGQMMMWLATSVLVIIMPRYLGDASSGKYTFSLALAGIFSVVVIFGSMTYLTREIAREPSRAPHMTFNALLSRIPMLVLAVGGMIGIAYAIGAPQSTLNVVYVAAAMMAVNAIGTTISAALQGLERMHLISIVAVIEKVLLVVVAVIVLMVLGLGVFALALATLASVVVSTTIRLAYFWKIVGFSPHVDIALWKTLFKSGVPFLVWSFALLIYGSIDITMLAIMTEDKVVGWYGLAYRFIGVPAFIPFAVTTALLPTLSSSKGEEFNKLARRCVDLLVLISLPIALFFAVGAGAIIETFRYPEGFDNSIILIRILALQGPLVAVSMVVGTALVASNREGPWARVAIVAMFLNPAMNLVAIPMASSMYDNGAIGAAIATVITEIFMVTAALVLMQRGVFVRSNAVMAARCSAAGVPMAVAMIAVAPYGLIPIMIAGGFVYPVAALAVGAVQPSDLREISKLVLSRGRAEQPAPARQQPDAALEPA